MSFERWKFATYERILAVFLDGFEDFLDFNFHGAYDYDLANDWEWLLATAKATRLAVMTCTCMHVWCTCGCMAMGDGTKY